MTGRAAGFCAGYTMPGFMNPMPGQGYGMGRGRGRGRGLGMGMAWRHGWGGMFYPAAVHPEQYAAASDPQDEVGALKNQAKYFSEALENINKRIAEL